MSNVTLSEFIEKLNPLYPQAFELVGEAKYGEGREKWKALIEKPLNTALPEFCEILVFYVFMSVLDVDAAPSAEDELRSDFRFKKEANLLGNDEQNFEAFCAKTREELMRQRKDIGNKHIGLQQLEVALREQSIRVGLDQPFGVAEFCVTRRLAEITPDGRLIFPRFSEA